VKALHTRAPEVLYEYIRGEYRGTWEPIWGRASGRRDYKTPWIWFASELCRPSDRRFLAK
jgi:hypothetical protein